MTNKLIIIFVIFLLPLSNITLADDDHDDHTEPITTSASKEHDHDHAESLIVELTPEAASLTGIKTDTARIGRIDQIIELPGELGFNEDRLVHIAPRFAGIAVAANFRAGDYVDKDETMAVIESNESMNSYSIKAPISGWVIERHITRGEYVSEENSIYVIADLSTVWVNLAVYPKDANRIKKGQSTLIKVIGSETTTTGVIEYISPIVDFHTRSLTARIVVPNPDNKWRPRSFVQGLITVASGKEALVVEKAAVQHLDGETVVFVVDGDQRYRPVEVLTGDADSNNIQIKSGLKIGERYVAAGAFELKAKIVTSNLDPHAGHGH